MSRCYSAFKRSQGNLDIICTYLDATSSAARRKAIHKLASHLRPQSTTLSILLGDFNFVMDPKDRWSATAGDWADNGDGGDASLLQDEILEPFGLVEWEQEHYTCDAKGAKAKLDRIYVNQHVSVKQDAIFFSVAILAQAILAQAILAQA